MFGIASVMLSKLYAFINIVTTIHEVPENHRTTTSQIVYHMSQEVQITVLLTHHLNQGRIETHYLNQGWRIGQHYPGG